MIPGIGVENAETSQDTIGTAKRAESRDQRRETATEKAEEKATETTIGTAGYLTVKDLVAAESERISHEH